MLKSERCRSTYVFKDEYVNIVDLVKSFPTTIYLQNLASIQKRTSPVKFAHLAAKSGKGSISNLSTKVAAGSWTVGRTLVPLPHPSFRVFFHPAHRHRVFRLSSLECGFPNYPIVFWTSIGHPLPPQAHRAREVFKDTNE